MEVRGFPQAQRVHTKTKSHLAELVQRPLVRDLNSTLEVP